MRISDRSADVCSSDLGPVHAPPTTATLHDEPSGMLLGIASEIFGKLYTGNSDHKFRGIQKCADILRMIDSECDGAGEREQLRSGSSEGNFAFQGDAYEPGLLLHWISAQAVVRRKSILIGAVGYFL